MVKKRMGRPPKEPNERKSAVIFIPVTDAEREQIYAAAEADEAKPTTWARETLLRAAKRRAGK
jgi:hypothetical protein